MNSTARPALLALALVAATGTAAVADCPPAGQRVMLASEGANPDVFVFDSRDRLVRYVSGSWTSTHDIMQHTMLVPAGTLAAVVQCRAGEAHPADAVLFGVRLVSGSHAGRYGWVAGSDVHAERRAPAPGASPNHRNAQ